MNLETLWKHAEYLRMKTDEVIAEFRKIKQEYTYNPDIMCEDDPRISRVKEIIDNKLSREDKTIILL